MAEDSSRKASKRKPTKRPAERAATIADPHYSQLSSKSMAGGTKRYGSSIRLSAADSDDTGSASGMSGATAFETLTADAQQRVYGRRSPHRQNQGNKAGVIVGLVLVAGFIAGGLAFWTHRPVNIKVNDAYESVMIGSSLDDVYNDLGISTNPGNYIDVEKEVIKEGEGYAYSAKVDDKDLSREDIESFRIKGGEQIEFTDGGDRMEEYDIEYQEVQPKLLFDGDWGAISFVKQWGKVGKLEIRTGKDSGKKANGEWVEELQDCIIRIKNITPENDQKLVALTFDDGPAATYTEEYLSILQEHDAKATFFNLSPNVESYPDLAKKVVESGNQICSHTNNHYQLTSLNQEDFLYEVTSAHDTIQSITGVDTSIIRPPYGDFGQNCWLMSQGTISVSVLWTNDALDWSLPGVDAIVDNALNSISSGCVILMHDGGGDRSQNLEALPEIIERLQDAGYKLVTINELLASDPEVPDSLIAGDAKMPEDAVWPTEIGEMPEEEE